MTKGLKINLMVQKCLMAAYAYYALDYNIMSDAEYDYLCRKLQENYDKITHEHKHLLGYDIEGEHLINSFIDWQAMPNIIKQATHQNLIDELKIDRKELLERINYLSSVKTI